MISNSLNRLNFNYLAIFVIIILLISSCSTQFDNDDPEIERKDGQTFIIDRTRKRWNITHAIAKYGMEAERFQFGLGPFAITPILNPKFINPGESGYPGNDDNQLIIGTNLNNDTRAYPIDVLSRHEIVDEEFGDTHVAVAY
jgi:hypothetical protein